MILANNNDEYVCLIFYLMFNVKVLNIHPIEMIQSEGNVVSCACKPNIKTGRANFIQYENRACKFWTMIMNTIEICFIFLSSAARCTYNFNCQNEHVRICIEG